MSLDLLGVAVVGAAGGVLSGLLGVGGGIIFVPALVVFLGEDQHVAQGVSLMVIVVTAMVGSFTHHRLGNIDLVVVRWAAPGAVVAGLAGAYVAGLLGTGALRALFGAIGMLLSLQLGYTAILGMGRVKPVPEGGHADSIDPSDFRC